MYHVLLVDDEENVLEILKENVEWQELGVDLLLTAKDGQNALEVLKKYRIDLLITDVKMPRLDGISLIREAKNQYPQIRCILLTAYGEFEYARQAISLGVENYLLKPVSKEELEQSVKKALGNLYRKRQKEESTLWNNILHRWVEGNISEEELADRAMVFGLNLYLPQYCVVCFVKRTEDQVNHFYSVCVERLEEQFDVYPFWDEKGRYILIVGGREPDTKAMGKMLSELAVQESADGKVGISFGTPVSDAGNLHLSYQVACDCLELFDYKEAGIILQNDYLSQGIETDLLVEEVRFLFFSGDEKIKCNGYKHFGIKLYQAVQNGETDKMLVRLLGICMKVLVTEFPLQEGLQEQVFAIKCNNGMGLAKETFVEEAAKILSMVYQIFERCFAQFSPIVQLAIKYVRDGVMSGEGGSVKEFCAHNGMNPAYLGHIYKKETGYFFNDYLTQCRINRSVLLLRNPNNKIKDIAETVGFMSVSYYVKCFRENKGVSPAKYQRGIDG